MTKVVKIGKLAIGGKNPVRIKGMLKSFYSKPAALIKEALGLEAEGAEAIRMAVRNPQDAVLVKDIKKEIKVPMVADVHFDWRSAAAAIDAGFDAIRLNPMNIYKPEQVARVAAMAKDKGISIRVGVNSGGFRRRFSHPRQLAAMMADRALRYTALLEKNRFFDIMVSLKGSDVVSTIEANRIFAGKSLYPIHLGVTATGSHEEALVKSAIGIGSLLSAGIGSVIRVSLTAPSIDEIRAAKLILQALDKRSFGVEVISCPTCSRCEIDLSRIAEGIRLAFIRQPLKRRLKIAVMGCVVNGPGEAAQADIGAAFGKKHAVIFRRGKIIKRVGAPGVIRELIREARKL